MQFNIIFIVAALIVIGWLFSRDFYQGMAATLLVLIVAPYNIFFDLRGPLPYLSIHRLLIVEMALFWLASSDIDKSPRRIPFVIAFMLVLFTTMLSAFNSLVQLDSVKSFLSLLVEEFVLYYILATSLASLSQRQLHKQVRRWAYLFVSGLSAVALLGVIERWTGFNFVDYLPTHAELPFYLEGNVFVYRHRVTATYPHAILLGYALAMVWPFTLVFMDEVESGLKKRLLLLSFFMFGSVIFFSESRGAWMGTILAGLIMFLFGSWNMRRRLAWGGLLLFVVLLFRPQVTASMVNLMNTTFNINTMKGRSANYRVELWHKAWREIRSAEPKRAWLGYGDNVRHIMDWSGWEEATGMFSSFWSWDNEYAVVVLERGTLGFWAFAFLFLFILWYNLKTVRYWDSDDRDFALAYWGMLAVFVFMMTNVKVFSPQVKTLFYAATAALGVIGTTQEEEYTLEEEDEAEEGEDEEDEDTDEFDDDEDEDEEESRERIAGVLS
jgi:hypothetical protein